MTYHSTPEDVASRIHAVRKSEGRSVRWLSERTGIAYPTLRRKLEHRPDNLTIAELIVIASALDIAVELLTAAPIKVGTAA